MEQCEDISCFFAVVSKRPHQIALYAYWAIETRLGGSTEPPPSSNLAWRNPHPSSQTRKLHHTKLYNTNLMKQQFFPAGFAPLNYVESLTTETTLGPQVNPKIPHDNRLDPEDTRSCYIFTHSQTWI